MPSNDTDNIYSSEYRDSAEPIPATVIGYDNTTSHMTATTVQGAIDELSDDIAGLDGDDISYDGTTSGLSATTTQDAIDELAGDIDDIVQMPALPADSADGTYVLKATASSGTITYAWVIEV